MGLADAFNAEDRVQVKYSNFYEMVEAAAKAKLLINAVNCDVPHEYIRCMVTGKGLLSAYKDTGMSPEDIKTAQKLLSEYTDLCLSPEKIKDLKSQLSEKTKKVNSLEAENQKLKAKLERWSAQKNEQMQKATQENVTDLPAAEASKQDEAKENKQ